MQWTRKKNLRIFGFVLLVAGCFKSCCKLLFELTLRNNGLKIQVSTANSIPLDFLLHHCTVPGTYIHYYHHVYWLEMGYKQVPVRIRK